MLSEIKVWLIGNYPLDAQESMQRFAALLLRELEQRKIQTVLLRPVVWAGRFGAGNSGLSKWLGYVDKFLLFPRFLQRRLEAGPGPDLVHICDHANAPYASALRGLPHLITCHDLLAIRSALGEFPAHRTRWTGRRLQKHIHAALQQAPRIVCVSKATLDDCVRIIGLRHPRSSVVYNGLNDQYQPIPRTIIAGILAQRGLPKSFLLHVGGNQWYKNRLGLLQIYAELCGRQTDIPPLLLVGKPLDLSLRQFLANARLGTKVFSMPDCSTQELAALYSQAELLLFPSLAEGFGWPILEAMACGCPVVTTQRAPMTEVGGDAAIYLLPEQIEEAAVIVHRVLRQPEGEKQKMIASGLAQASRFSTAGMIEQYLDVYEELMSGAA